MILTESKSYNRTLGVTIFLTSVLLYNSNKQGKAPYGRFGDAAKHGVSLDPRFGWWLMELPATLSFAYNFYKGIQNRKEKKTNINNGPSKKTSIILGLIWFRHYFNRGWFFPLSIRVRQGSKQSFALYNALIGGIFLSSHGYLNARMFTEYGKHLTDDWLNTKQFKLGMLIYEIGFWITVHSEYIIRNLRDKNPAKASAYKIPIGGLFKYVTNPQYLGEITAFTGLLILSGSLSPLPAVLITLSNLVPRAKQNHIWYLKKFENYPKERKYLIPFIW